MFGATSSSTPAPAAGTSLFGTPPAAAQQQQQQQPGSSIFGAIAPFGQQAQQAQQQQQQLAAGMQLSALGYPASEQDELRRRLEAIIAAYTPCSTSYKFQHLFLNVVGNPAQRVRPPQVFDELSWKQALREAGGPDNPDRCAWSGRAADCMLACLGMECRRWSACICCAVPAPSHAHPHPQTRGHHAWTPSHQAVAGGCCWLQRPAGARHRAGGGAG
jgi:hypothetical protein